MPETPGCVVVRDRDAVLALPEVASAPEVAVIGGGEIYALFLPLADRLELTMVHAAVEGDARFPEWRNGHWERTRDDLHPADEKHAHAFRFTTWRRISPEKQP
jgi:dihydrofolate reductase